MHASDSGTDDAWADLDAGEARAMTTLAWDSAEQADRRARQRRMGRVTDVVGEETLTLYDTERATQWITSDLVVDVEGVR